MPSELLRLDGKVALVTGSARDLGKSIAVFLGSEAASFVTRQVIVADGGVSIV